MVLNMVEWNGRTRKANPNRWDKDSMVIIIIADSVLFCGALCVILVLVSYFFLLGVCFIFLIKACLSSLFFYFYFLLYISFSCMALFNNSFNGHMIFWIYLFGWLLSFVTQLIYCLLLLTSGHAVAICRTDEQILSSYMQIIAFLIPLLDDKFPLIRSITCWTLSRFSKFVVQVRPQLRENQSTTSLASPFFYLFHTSA